MDARTREIIRIDHLATGGEEDGLSYGTSTGNIMDRYQPAEYVPELLPGGLRKDLKQLNVVQPDGPSFKVTDESLIEWQKWRFRVGFNYREGATLHDIRYDGRSVMYRLSVSEMVRISIHEGTFCADSVDRPIRRSSSSIPTEAGLRFRRWRSGNLRQQPSAWMRLLGSYQGILIFQSSSLMRS